MPTNNYSYTGGYQYFTVPTGVTSVTISCSGAGSGSRAGGRVTGKRAVSGGQVLVVVCGQAGIAASGANGGARGWGGGGAGGDANNATGGDGGGGYSAVRLGSASGTIICVAGGAGGDSGDSGAGGQGGATTGAAGGRGTSGSNSTGAATGGTQSQGGNGGTSSSGSEFDGHDATDTVVGAYGGTGGGPSPYHAHGGGGGGGGYHQGGGGQASSFGFAPGGGGGGGSNYTGGLTSATTERGTGGTGGGNVSITWVTPGPANQPPNTPTTAKINGTDEAAEFPTKSTGTVAISAVLTDPEADTCRLLVRISSVSNFSSYTDHFSGYVSSGGTASVSLTGLAQNTHYYVRLYNQDNHGLYSLGYNSLDFWTNRQPNPPVLLTPAENATVPSLSSVVFTWTHSDPDPSDSQTGFRLQYRTQATITKPAGPWVLIDQPTVAPSTWTLNPGTLKGTTFYEWQVATKDEQGLWGPYSTANSFFVSSATSPPRLLSPINDEAIDVNAETTLQWRFVDPDAGDAQTRGDIRYRIIGQPDTQWVTVLGDVGPGVPGDDGFWVLPPATFISNYHYEWQVRTYDTLGGLASDWSESETFWATGTPGQAVVGAPVVPSAFVKGSLGCGEYRVLIYAQGGETIVGELNPISSLNFKRIRDDISNCVIRTNGKGQDCGGFYGSLHAWIHEVVVFRSTGDGQWSREWEGPITRISYQGDVVEVEAQDVMVYAYRRIMRQGYNDSYQLVDGQQVGLRSAVLRAQQILVNALAPYDPNILPYLTALTFSDDAKQSRVVADYSRMAWEEVDDLAAKGGIDYTTVGRRILIWDTHRSIGRLPEMRDKDFSDIPIITEYGMNLCNYAAVTNGSGVWGAATPKFTLPPPAQIISGGFNHIVLGTLHPQPVNTDPFQSYGPIEMLASAYGEAAGGADEVLTPAAKAALVSAMTDQATRNLNDRWPTPVEVRVPDNSALSPDVNATFDQLVPGVWIPLRSNQYLREVVQWQKLDSVTVDFTPEDGEKVTVVMSPAPNAGQDPDDDAAAAEETG